VVEEEMEAITSHSSRKLLGNELLVTPIVEEVGVKEFL
jgi:hypothetical protein